MLELRVRYEGFQLVSSAQDYLEDGHGAFPSRAGQLPGLSDREVPVDRRETSEPTPPLRAQEARNVGALRKMG